MEKVPEVPQKVGDYKIKGKIGKGGQGQVYLGKHTTRFGKYVLKQFKYSEVGKNEVEVLRKLTSLQNDNIVKCLNFIPGSIENKERTTIEMEYCSGGTLHDEIESCKENKEKFPEIQILSWLLQLANGLESIHSQNIIHQDIKPHNILITAEGVLRIADFGASRILCSPDGYSRDIEGSVLYMSPEALIHHTVTKMSDIWSLGVLAYQLCCLRCPYYPPNQYSLRYNFKYKKSFLFPIPKDYSTDLVNIVKSMLQKNPSNRPTIPKLIKALQMAKAKNLCFLIKKYKKFGFDKKAFIKLVNCIQSPYCLRFFLNPDMQDEKFFDRSHCCRRMHKNEEIITQLFFGKSGEHQEIFFDKGKLSNKMLYPFGMQADSRIGKITYENENKLKESNLGILDYLSLPYF